MNERKAQVYFNQVLAGELIKHETGYVFRYDPGYLADTRMPSISLTLPKTKAEYHSNVLFPFFFGLLAEGENKAMQCQILKIDEDDHFTRLIKTAGTDTVGAIIVMET